MNSNNRQPHAKLHVRKAICLLALFCPVVCVCVWYRRCSTALKNVIGCRRYVMTSPQTHNDTVEAFHDNAFYGLDPADVMFFQQVRLGPGAAPVGLAPKMSCR